MKKLSYRILKHASICLNLKSKYSLMTLQRKKDSHNPFAFKAKAAKKGSGKRVGKSKPQKANNQLNRRVK